jgi:hypothetical protein
MEVLSGWRPNVKSWKPWEQDWKSRKVFFQRIKTKLPKFNFLK